VRIVSNEALVVWILGELYAPLAHLLGKGLVFCVEQLRNFQEGFLPSYVVMLFLQYGDIVSHYFVAFSIRL
jgi:hypothetical protein